MKTVDINLGARAYQVRIGAGLLSMADEIVPWVKGRQVCIVSDETVAPLYLERLRDALAGKQVVSVILPAGESGKNLDGAERIFDALLGAPCDRGVTVIALGGGVVGDLAGFAAACYQRGVPFIQAPTTLLAQVDSSVGGKTGVNHPLGKNMIGAFHQPRRVLADTATLDTLDQRQLRAGLAEVIKYGVIADPDFFAWLEEHIEAALARDPETVAHIIERSCLNKARIVEQDEREHEDKKGGRALLNLGHTFGHAIETGAGYGNWLHGEAVATGIAMASHLSQQMGRLSAGECARIGDLLSAAGLPVDPFTGLPAARMLELMKVDKKNRDGVLRLVLPTGIGKAEVVSDCPAGVLAETVAHFAVAETAAQSVGQLSDDMLIEFNDNDDAYQDWMAKHPYGFVVNTRRGITPKYMVLHRARCSHITVYAITQPHGGFTERIFIKACAPTVEDLRDWVKAHGRPDGTFTKKCATCNPV